MIPTTLPPDAAAVIADRRRERINALRACRPMERVFLRQLPKSRYSPYVAAKVLGYSDSTVWKLMQRARVKRAMELFLRDALEEIAVSHASLVADLQTIKERCMQVQPVLDKEGKPTGEFQFDAKNAIAAIKEIAELMKLAPAKRVEVTGSVGVSMSAQATRAVANRLEEITDPNDAALLYQQLMYGKVTVEKPTSVN